jgi:hypothetical protein
MVKREETARVRPERWNQYKYEHRGRKEEKRPAEGVALYQAQATAQEVLSQDISRIYQM